METREKDHSLTLKVMRLTKPSFATSIPITCDDDDLPGFSFSEIMTADLSFQPCLPRFQPSELLSLPQSFGDIFLGETFSCYLSVHNDSGQDVKDVVVKADLQTTTQRFSLSNSSMPHSCIHPADSFDDIVHHEVKELGNHILVCTISYTPLGREKTSFRKFFKFSVLKPIDIKTKSYNPEMPETNNVFLEAQITNTTSSPMYMERVILEPSSLYNVEDLNCEIKGDYSYLNPNEEKLYLFRLSPSKGCEEVVCKGVTSVGKLDIVWKTNLGERGRLQTGQLQRVAVGTGNLRLSVVSIPFSVQLLDTFQVDIVVTNCSERTMELSFALSDDDLSGLRWCGVSRRSLGKCIQNASINLSFNIVAIKTGLLSLSGLKLTDTYLKRTYEFDDLAQVFVKLEDFEEQSNFV